MQLNEVSLDIPGSGAYDRFVTSIYTPLHPYMILVVVMELRKYMVLLIMK
jgi:hypothetical protein